MITQQCSVEQILKQKKRNFGLGMGYELVHELHSFFIIWINRKRRDWLVIQTSQDLSDLQWRQISAHFNNSTYAVRIKSLETSE